ncbi:hypothetical protein P7C70_g7571, partial [Phenoliferia sp. Uapishka_3]
PAPVRKRKPAVRAPRNARPPIPPPPAPDLDTDNESDFPSSSHSSASDSDSPRTRTTTTPKKVPSKPAKQAPARNPRKNNNKKRALCDDIDADPTAPPPKRTRLAQSAVLSVEASSVAQAAILAEHYHATSTAASYQGYIRRGLAFRLECIKSDRAAGIYPPSQDHLEDALEVLSYRTVKWITRFLVHQHEVGNCQYGVIEGTRSAFKDYYKKTWNVDGPFLYDRLTGEHKGGNPCDDLQLCMVVKSYKKKHGRETGGRSRQSLPMKFEYMNHIHDYLLSLDQTNDENVFFRLYMMALLSLGFQLWTRIEEELELFLEDFQFHLTTKSGTPYFTCTLTLRKTNTHNKKKKSVFQIHPELEADRHGVDAYTHVMAFYNARRKYTGCDEHPKHYFFGQTVGLVMKVCRFHTPPRSRRFDGQLTPSFSCPSLSCPLQVGSATSQAEITRKLDACVYPNKVLALLLVALVGRLTLHCLRRGGAQDCFIYASERWTITVCKWWGGWAKGESAGTLVRYLLESHNLDIEQYGDMLNPDRDDRRHLLQRGADANTVPTFNDLNKALVLSSAEVRAEGKESIKELGKQVRMLDRARGQQISDGFASLRDMFGGLQVGSSGSGTSLVPTAGSSLSLPPVLPTPLPLPNPAPSSSRLFPAVIAAPLERTPTEVDDEALAAAGWPTSTTPAPLYIPRADKWEEAISQWSIANREKGLDYALERWPERWLATCKRLSSIYAARKAVQDAYNDVNRDNAAFLEKYGGKGHATGKILLEPRRLLGGAETSKIKNRVGCKQRRENEAAALLFGS